jgi:hypothetical protein
MKRTELLSIAIGCGGVLLAAAALTAGPLDPPSGTIAPTYKTLSEVEPRIAINLTNTPGDSDSTFKITQPGSYYLTQNQTTKAGAFIGIEIATSNVSIDLNGFMLSGNSDATRPAITCTTFAENVSISNGTIAAYQAAGIELINATNVTLENLTAKFCNNGGYRVSGAYRIVRCIANNNSVFGFNASGPGVVQDSVANFNGGVGFQLAGNAAAISCVANGNATKGFESNLSSLTNCSASNSSMGIHALSSTITGCFATSCGDTGFQVEGSTATSCTSNQNGQHGFRVTASNLDRCVANNNASNGVYVTFDSTVRDSTFMYNGTNGTFAGIHINGDGNRIEGNNSGFQDIGINAAGPRNFIARNTCRGNSVNWNITANNVCLVVVAATSAAINGNSGGVGPGSVDPSANFSY